jgi:hypothetical protein
MRLTAEGRLGIGTTSPGTMLQIEGSEAYLTLKNSDAENGDGEAETKIIFEDHGNNSLAQIQASHDGTSDDNKGRLDFFTNDDSGAANVLSIDSTGIMSLKGGTTLDNSNDATVFKISETNIHLDGNVGVGKVPTVKLDVNGAITSSGDISGVAGTFSGVLKTTNNAASDSTSAGALIVTGGVGIGGAINAGGAGTFSGVLKTTNNTASNSTSNGALIVTGGVGIGGAINAGGAGTFSGAVSGTTGSFSSTCTAQAFNATSDLRHKKNITPLQDSLSKILQIKGVNFEFIEDLHHHKHAGIIAQEVAEIIPEAINKSDDDKWCANYNTLIAYLIESVKTLKEENIQQDQKISSLEARLDAQEKLIQGILGTISK